MEEENDRGRKRGEREVMTEGRKEDSLVMDRNSW